MRTADGTVQEWRLHHIDGLRQQARGRGLDDLPREQPGAIERPDGTFELVTVQATKQEILVAEKAWRFRPAGPLPLRAATCLPSTLVVGTGGVGPIRLGARLTEALEDLPAPSRRTATGVRWCVDGGGTLGAALTRGGRIALVRTTAPGHTLRGVRTGTRSSRARRTFRHRRGVTPDVFRVVRGGRRVVEVRGGRVRSLAVTGRRVAASPARLRAALRAAR